VYLFFQIFGKLGMTTSRFATHAQSKNFKLTIIITQPFKKT